MIRCRPTGEFYIGGTKTNFAHRFASHVQTLNAGRSTIPKLQAAFDQHGAAEIEFIPLKAFNPEEVRDREREAIRRLRPAFNNPPTQEVDIIALSKQSGLSQQVIRARLFRGLTGDDLTAPPHQAKRKEYTRR